MELSPMDTTPTIRLNAKLNVTQARVEYAGQSWKHVVLTLRGTQTIAATRESPELWTSIQADMAMKVG